MALWAFLPYVILSMAHVILLAIDNPVAGPTKLLLMPLLAIPVIVSASSLKRAPLALIATALLFSWLGDGAGTLFPTAPELPLMLGFFGIAHLAYIALFATYAAQRRVPIGAVVYAIWWVAMILVLGPHTGGLLIAVGLYGLVLGGTATLAARCSPLVAVGGAFFLVSDTVLAFQLFLPDSVSPWGSPAVMLTYTLGQGLIVAGVLATLTRKRAS